jgi:cytochrome bd-type quinol oxidase subunit 2
MILKIFCLLIMSFFTLVFSQAKPVAALNILGDACRGNNGPTCQQNRKQAGSNVNPAIDTIHNAANLIAAIAGVIAVFTIIYSGLRYILSGNNPEGQKQAREILQNAIIGLIIIALAWVIVTAVTNVLV